MSGRVTANQGFSTAEISIAPPFDTGKLTTLVVVAEVSLILQYGEMLFQLSLPRKVNLCSERLCVAVSTHWQTDFLLASLTGTEILWI